MENDSVTWVYTSTVRGERYTKTMHFENRNDKIKCNADIQNVKYVASTIDWQSLDASNPDDVTRVKEWMGLCIVTIGVKWGWGRLPKDIRIQFNACETIFLGLEATDFGEDVGCFVYESLRKNNR